MGNSDSQQISSSNQRYYRTPEPRQHQADLRTDCRSNQRGLDQQRSKSYRSMDKHFRRLGNPRQNLHRIQSKSMFKSYYPISHPKQNSSSQLDTSSNQLSRMLKRLTLEESRRTQKCPKSATPHAKDARNEILSIYPASSKQQLNQDDINEFVQNQQRFLERRDLSIERSRSKIKEEEMKDCTHQPSLNKKSLKIVQKNRKRSNGVPTIKGFQEMNVDLPIKQRLNEGLKHTNQMSTFGYAPYVANNNFVLPLIREFCASLPSEEPFRKLTYLDLTELLKKLGFIGSMERIDCQNFIVQRSLINDLWILISMKGGWTDSLSVLSFLLALFKEDFRGWRQQVQRLIGEPPLDCSFEQRQLASNKQFRSPNNFAESELQTRHPASEQTNAINQTTPIKNRPHDLAQNHQAFSFSEKKRTIVSLSQSSSNRKDTPKKKIILKKPDDTVRKPTEDTQTFNHQTTNKKVSLAVIFEGIERSRKTSSVQLSAEQLGVTFGSRKESGYLLYSPTQIAQVAAYFKLFATNKLHRIKAHQYGTACYSVGPLESDPGRSVELLLKAEKLQPIPIEHESPQQLKTDELAERRKERILNAARTMRIIRTCDEPATFAEMSKIEELVKDRRRQNSIQQLCQEIDAECTFQPNVSFGGRKEPQLPAPNKFLEKHQQKHQRKGSAAETRQSSKFQYAVCNQPDVILHVDIYVDNRKLTMQMTKQDTPTSVTRRFLRENGISPKWQQQIASTVQQALLDIQKEEVR